MLKRLRKTHRNQLSIGFMVTCTHKSIQEICIHIVEGVGGGVGGIIS